MPLASLQFWIVTQRFSSTLLTVSFIEWSQQCAPGKFTDLDCDTAVFFNIADYHLLNGLSNVPLASLQFWIVTQRFSSTLLTVSFIEWSQQCAPGEFADLDCGIASFVHITDYVIY